MNKRAQKLAEEQKVTDKILSAIKMIDMAFKPRDDGKWQASKDTSLDDTGITMRI